MRENLKQLTSIFILTKDNLEATTICLESLFRHTNQKKTPYEIIVVDNASIDGTVDYLKKLSEEGKIRVIFNKNNVGFPAGNNQAAAIAEGDYFCLLNNDTILTNSWLEKLLRVLRSDPKIAVVGPHTNSGNGVTLKNLPYNDDKGLAEFARQSRKTEDRLFLTFFCCVMRRITWNEFGGLDEDFRMGLYEDIYFCYRAKEKGYKLMIVDCYIHHQGGGSFGYNENNQAKIDKYLALNAENQKLFLRKIDKYKTIALCMIVSDQEKPETLKRCLDSIVPWVDDVYIVFNYKRWPQDKRSEDYGNLVYPKRFENIIRRFCSKTRYVKWTNFSDMRNQSLDLAGYEDYIIWMDTDDVMVSPINIRDAILRNPDADVLKCEVLSYNPNNRIEYIIHDRIFKNKKEYRFRNRVHEDIRLSMHENEAKLIRTNIRIHHFGNLDVEKQKRSNRRNYKLIMKDLQEPDAHSLAYYAVVNCLLLEAGWAKSRKKDIKLSVKAIKYIDECFEKFNLTKEDPLTPKMWVIRGIACIHVGNRLAAKQSFHKAWDEWKHPEAAVNLARLYMEEREWSKAIDILETLYNFGEIQVANIPIDMREVEILMFHKLGDCYLNLWAETVVMKKDMKKISQSAVDKCNERAKEFYIKAEENYSKCFYVDPGNLEVGDKLVQILTRTNRPKEMVSLCLMLVNRFPGYFNGWYMLSQYELSSRRYETARVFLEKTLALKPDHIEAKHNLEMLDKIRRGG